MSRQPTQPVQSGKSNATPSPTNNSGAVKYGQNGFGSASSDVPGQRTVSTLASDMDDPVLATVRERGAKHSDDPSTFTGRGGKPTPKVAVGNKASTPSPAKVPNACGGCED